MALGEINGIPIIYLIIAALALCVCCIACCLVYFVKKSNKAKKELYDLDTARKSTRTMTLEMVVNTVSDPNADTPDDNASHPASIKTDAASQQSEFHDSNNGKQQYLHSQQNVHRGSNTSSITPVPNQQPHNPSTNIVNANPYAWANNNNNGAQQHSSRHLNALNPQQSASESYNRSKNPYNHTTAFMKLHSASASPEIRGIPAPPPPAAGPGTDTVHISMNNNNNMHNNMQNNGNNNNMYNRPRPESTASSVWGPGGNAQYYNPGGAFQHFSPGGSPRQQFQTNTAGMSPRQQFQPNYTSPVSNQHNMNFQTNPNNPYQPYNPNQNMAMPPIHQNMAYQQQMNGQQQQQPPYPIAPQRGMMSVRSVLSDLQPDKHDEEEEEEYETDSESDSQSHSGTGSTSATSNSHSDDTDETHPDDVSHPNDGSRTGINDQVDEPTQHTTANTTHSNMNAMIHNISAPGSQQSMNRQQQEDSNKNINMQLHDAMNYLNQQNGSNGNMQNGSNMTLTQQPTMPGSQMSLWTESNMNQPQPQSLRNMNIGESAITLDHEPNPSKENLPNLALIGGSMMGNALGLTANHGKMESYDTATTGVNTPTLDQNVTPTIEQKETAHEAMESMNSQQGHFPATGTMILHHGLTGSSQFGGGVVGVPVNGSNGNMNHLGFNDEAMNYSLEDSTQL